MRWRRDRNDVLLKRIKIRYGTWKDNLLLERIRNRYGPWKDNKDDFVSGGYVDKQLSGLLSSGSFMDSCKYDKVLIH